MRFTLLFYLSSIVDGVREIKSKIPSVRCNEDPKLTTVDVGGLWRPVFPHVYLSRRGEVAPADDEAFNKAAYKGVKLLKQMLATDKLAGEILENPSKTVQSAFVKLSDLEQWGYRVLGYNDYFDFDTALPIKRALESMGISTKKIEEGGNNQAFLWEHEVETEHDGIQFPASGASFTTIFNPVDGVIVAWGSFGAAYMGGRKNPPVTTIPQLKTWSDVIFVQWQDLNSPKNLKYVFRAPIENKETHALVLRALKNINKELSGWPGYTFDMASMEGKTILGSPNGAGVAFLLAQHKHQLGNKIVDKITVFQDEGRNVPRPPSLVFYIKDVEPVKDMDDLNKMVSES